MTKFKLKTRTGLNRKDVQNYQTDQVVNDLNVVEEITIYPAHQHKIDRGYTYKPNGKL